MKPPGNVWTERLRGLDDPAVIRKRTLVPPKPLLGLMDEPCEKAVTRLDVGLASVFYPTERVCELLQEHVQRAQAFVAGRYPLVTSFLDLVGDDDLSSLTKRPSCWCLTGPAGVGKSALVAALERLLPGADAAYLTEQYPMHPISGLRRVVVEAMVSDNELLSALGNAAVLGTVQRKKRSDLVQHVRQWFACTGVPTLCCDELQFVTQSASANTQVARLLLVLAYLGVPFTYVGNYSLVHRLKKRPHEERQRLLASPKLLFPDPPDSECWRKVLASMFAVAPGVLMLDPEVHALELHRLTGGLKRVLRQLVVSAFRLAHARTRDRHVGLDDILEAYRSEAFAVNREDVETSVSLEISSGRRPQRLDLVCPFASRALPGERAVRAISPTRQKRVATAILEGSLNQEERAALATLRAAAEGAAGKPKSATSVVQLRKSRKPLTLELLQEGNAAADRVLRPGAQSPDGEDSL